MQTRNRALLLGAIAVFWLSQAALAETGGRLVGHVVDENFQPLQEALITVTGTGAVGVYTSRTDEKGWYSIVGLPMHEALIVKGEAPGKIDKVYAGIWVQRGQDTERDFRLRPPGHHEILVLLDPDNPTHVLALEGARSTLPGSIVEAVVKGTTLKDERLVRYEISHLPNAVVSIGRDASLLARREARQSPMIFMLVPDPKGDKLLRSNSCGIALNSGLQEQLARLAEVAPGAKNLVTVFNPRRLARVVRDLRAAAKERGMTLTARSARSVEEAARVLERMRSDPADVFFLLHDPEFFDEPRLSLIRKFVEERDLIYVVPDTYFFDMGGNLTDAPGFRAMGEEAGIIVRHVLGGSPALLELGVVVPDKRTFAVTPELRDRLGIAPVATGD